MIKFSKPVKLERNFDATASFEVEGLNFYIDNGESGASFELDKISAETLYNYLGCVLAIMEKQKVEKT